MLLIFRPSKCKPWPKLLLILLVVLTSACSSKTEKQFIITKADYLDRIKAMWTAQLVAVHMGWDFEHKPAAVKNITGYSESRLKAITENGGAEVDDDWYYEMVALAGFEKYGHNMTTYELGQQWLDFNMGTWGSAFYTRQALLRGVKGSEAGHPRNNRMWFTVGNQNRSDLYAMISPAMPNLTAAISRRLGHVNSYAEGTDGGILMGVLESMAFYESNPRELIKKAVLILDQTSPHRQCFETIIQMGENGSTWQETAKAIEQRWGIEYPGTNSAVWNAGFSCIALWYGDGDLMKSMNIAYQASDFSDADCQAANVATILAAMHGSRIFPDGLTQVFNNKITGKNLGFMELIAPVDENLDTLAMRTMRIGLQVLRQNGAVMDGENIIIPAQYKLETLPAERFHPNEFVRWWNPEWKMDRAGFGAPGGGVRGVRGGTFIDGEILATYPRDEIRGVKIFRTLTLSEKPRLRVEVAADPGRKWKLHIWADHRKLLTRIIDGGPALEWPEIKPEEYPQPLHEYEKAASVRKWETIELDLSDYRNQEVTIRLFQDILVRNGFPGNAYWRNLSIR